MNKAALTRIVNKILKTIENRYIGVSTASGKAEAQLRSLSLEDLNERYYELFDEYHTSLPVEGDGYYEHSRLFNDHSYESCGGL